ncbi:MAG: phospho-N-acetylmuramoyl-pentapeptide-transferase [Gammaproteobacteria bacterium]
MLLWLTQYLTEFYSGFNVFHYVTVRIILSVLTALLVALILGPGMIRWLASYKVGQTVRDDGPKSHFSKSGTPTMGGVLVIAAISIATLLWTDLTNHYVWIILFTLWSFGGIGFYDDYQKLVKKNPRGLSARWKYLWQSVAAIIIICALFMNTHDENYSKLLIPFFKDLYLELGPFYLLLAYFVIVGASNAVNLTDGLDGLAITSSVLVGGALGVFAYVTSHAFFADYLSIPFITQSSEIAIFSAALVGAGLGFLWFNAYPAQVFMGDVGSLSLGAVLGVMAIMVKQEIILFIMGGIFVAETFSVILQVVYFKMTKGKRIFRMAPLHHHFELQGWPEPKVMVRFCIITLMFVLLGLVSLKVR